jgi:hypothetical protein
MYLNFIEEQDNNTRGLNADNAAFDNRAKLALLIIGDNGEGGLQLTAFASELHKFLIMVDC